MSGANGALLRVRNLRVAYGRAAPTLVLDGVDLSLAAGEAIAVVGSSGSGKTTLIKAIAGLLPDDARVRAEELRFLGDDLRVATAGRWRRLRGSRVAYVPQDTSNSFDPLRTVGAHVRQARRLHDRGASTAALGRAAVEALAEAGFGEPEQVLAAYPHELSGGQRQRALIACALVNHPDLILTDEPTSGLDVTTQRLVLDQLRRLRRDRGVAVLLVTHDLLLAAAESERTIVLEQGRIVEEGRSAEVLSTPQHAITRALVAAAELPQRRPVPPSGSAVPTVLEVRDLSRLFARRGTEVEQGLRSASFQVRRGGTLGIVGESGSGKSTLSRLIAALDTSTSGSISYYPEAGAEIQVARLRGRARRAYWREVQYVYQNPYSALDPRCRAGALIAEPLAAFGLAPPVERAERVRRLLDEVGLPPQTAERGIASLSGGQRQRVAIARALAVEPRLLVLDEPVSALDVLVQDQVLELLVRLQQRRGISYILVSHDLGVINSIADQVCVLHAGRIVESGPTSSVFANPQSEWTRRLAATSLIPAVEAGMSERRAVAGSGAR